MYKTQLQELCQKKKWALPRYSCVKEGPDHNPCFTASVVVKGVTFDTTLHSNNIKDAQNDAAKLAVDHFIASEPKAETETGQPGIDIHQAGKLQSSEEEFKNDDMDDYKLRLQTYAQRNKLGIPLYLSDKIGPPHAPCFKAKVFVKRLPYESPGSYKTLEEAEIAAAQFALLSFAKDTLQKAPVSLQNSCPLYKNVLQELVQSIGCNLPIYKTEMSGGEPHNPSFISTVEVVGVIFQGTVAKSKKQAEVNAARAACTVFMERD